MNALVSRARKLEAASIRRLKREIARVVFQLSIRRDINAAIDAWHAAERERK